MASFIVPRSSKQKKEGPAGPSFRRKLVQAYFFFAFALLDDAEDFFEEAADFEPPFFAVAISFTTFPAVRDLTVALTWQKFAGSRRNSLKNFKEQSTAMRLNRDVR